jgi:hypothetical protein
MPTKTKAAPAVEELVPLPAPVEELVPLPAPVEELEDSLADPEEAWEDDYKDIGTEPDGQFHHEPVETSEAQEPEAVIRLTGAELLAFYKEKTAAGRSYPQIAFDAGYRTITKTGQERAMKTQFANAMLQAQGIDTGTSPTGSGGSHAGETRARVTGQGQLLVSQLAARKIGAQAGEVFEVSYPSDRTILLTPTGIVEPVRPRKGESIEQPGTPLLDDAQAA